MSERRAERLRRGGRGDGCTAWPDQWFGSDHRDCCDAHDEAYFFGGGPFGRLGADWALARCVWSKPGLVQKLNAVAMFIGVRIGGLKAWRWHGLDGWHWDYGEAGEEV